jgi:ABC-type transport system involved in multi-copper enzyme maturation permease subunit
MWKVAKYKILTLLDDKLFKVLVIAFFIILNYNVFLKSGILSDGSRDFNKILKYTLLINNFTIISTMFGQLVGMYIGSGLIGNDIYSGKLYIMLPSFPKRWKYLLGNLFGLIIIVTSFVLLILFNYFVSTTVLDVTVNYSDLLLCFTYIFTNIIVIMTVTAVSSIFIQGKASLVIGLIEMAIFEIYTYQKIPFLDYALNMNISTRRVLACLAPITNVTAPSIYSDGTLDRYMVTPLMINNMFIYQIVFIVLILIIGVISFKHKEL